MQILDDLIASLNFSTTVRDIRQGIFHTGVLTRHCGLAATLPRDVLCQEDSLVRQPGFLLRKTPRELARLCYSPKLLEAAIGMATINSLLTVDENRCCELNAAELIIQKGRDKRVAIVGHFPFISRVKHAAKETWIIEKNPQGNDASESEAGCLIPKADVVAITGSAFTNHTIEHLLRLCEPKAYVITLGDTAPLSTVLFEYGLDAISGTIVTDSKLALHCVSQGANFRQIQGVKRLTLYRNRGIL